MKTNQQNGSQMEFKQKINEELMRISDTVWSTNSKVRDQFCQAKKKKKSLQGRAAAEGEDKGRQPGIRSEPQLCNVKAFITI